MSFHLFHIRVSPQFPLNCRAIGIGDIMHVIILFSFTSLLMIPLKPRPFPPWDSFARAPERCSVASRPVGRRLLAATGATCLFGSSHICSWWSFVAYLTQLRF